MIPLVVIVAMAGATAAAPQMHSVTTDAPADWVTDGLVTTHVLDADRLYLGGYFQHIGPPTGSFVAIDAAGQVASALPRIDDPISAATADDQGGWWVAGGRTLSHVHADQSRTPIPLPESIATVTALALSGTTLFINNTGSFDYLQAINTTDSTLLPLYPQPDAPISTMQADSGILYISGVFTQVGGQRRMGYAAIDVASGTLLPWSSPFYPSDAAPLAVADGLVFTSIVQENSYLAQPRLVAIDANGAISGWNPTISGFPHTLSVSGGTVFVGGSAASMGAPGFVAAIDAASGATRWRQEADKPVTSIVSHQGVLYVGGAFTHIGSAQRSHLAALDPTTGAVANWSSDTSDTVRTLAVSADRLGVGGDFLSAQMLTRRHLAAVNTASGAATPWNPDVDGVVQTLAISGTAIYVGGDFAYVGGAARARLAAVDVATANATAWNPGADSNISSLAVAPNAIYAAGSFGQIGGQPRRNLAALDPISGAATAWSPQGISTDARSITVAGTQLYASGFFILDDATSTRANLVALDTQTGQVQNRFPAVSGNTVPLFLVDSTTVYVSYGSASHEGSDFWFGAYDRASAAERWRHRIDTLVLPLAVHDGLLYTGGGLVAIDGAHVERSKLAAFRASDGQLTVWQPAARGGAIDIFPTATDVYGFVVIASGDFGLRTSYVYSFQELGHLHESHMSLPMLMR